MNNSIKEVLLSSGWHEGRNICIDNYLNWYNSEGYIPSNSVITFLKEFGGLQITIPSKSNKSNCDSISNISIIIDPIENGYEYEFINDYEKFFSTNIFPIGISTGPPEIFMDSGGAFYAMYGCIGAKWGDTFEEFVTNIMSGNVNDLEKIY